MNKKAVIAVGGNSLIKDSCHQCINDQYTAIAETSVHIAEIVEEGYEVVLTHGNGPQVGFILLRSELSKHVIHPVPLDSCDADTQGAIGYAFQQTLGNEFLRKKIDKPVITVITQVVVDKNDEAFNNPSKPIGPFYSLEDAEMHRKEDKWDIVEDSGRGYRRVVASPFPQEIVEESVITGLINSGVVVIAVGGGGIPVIRNPDGTLKGVEAVIDKDHASSLLASNIKADTFIISTAVEKVYLNYSSSDQKALDEMTVKDAERFIRQGHFKPGSMLPKIKAAVAFLKNGGRQVIITKPEALLSSVKGETGTRIVSD